MDCHGAGKGWTFNSLVPEDLDPACEFVVQDEWTEYTEFLEDGCDAALFVGMHSRAGTADGVMNHTISGRDFQNLWFNGTLVGETGINPALCGTWGCPVLLVTGDDASCREGKELLRAGLTTVSVKRGFSSFSARNLAPSRAWELIETGAQQALSDLSAGKPYDPGSLCEIKVEFKHTGAAHKLRYRTGVEIVESRTIVSEPTRGGGRGRSSTSEAAPRSTELTPGRRTGVIARVDIRPQQGRRPQQPHGSNVVTWTTLRRRRMRCR